VKSSESRKPKGSSKGAEQAPKLTPKAIDEYVDREMKPGGMRMSGGYQTK